MTFGNVPVVIMKLIGTQSVGSSYLITAHTVA